MLLLLTVRINSKSNLFPPSDSFLVMLVVRAQAFCRWGVRTLIAITLLITVTLIFPLNYLFVAQILHFILGHNSRCANNYIRRDE